VVEEPAPLPRQRSKPAAGRHLNMLNLKPRKPDWERRSASGQPGQRPAVM